MIKVSNHFHIELKNGYKGIHGKITELRILNALQSGNSEYAKKLSTVLINKKNIFGYYHYSFVNFLYGDYEEALKLINYFNNNIAFFPEAFYLKAEILTKLTRKKEAWEVLEEISYRSKRLKTWLYMANIVDSKEDFYRLEENYKRFLTCKMVSKFNLALSEYLALGALRGKLYDESINIWRETFNKIRYNPSLIDSKNKFKKKYFTTKQASQALSDLREILDKANIEMFLISGTLLGCIRNNRLLGYDKDIDIGVWDSVNRLELIKSLQISGKFLLLPMRTINTIRVKHINGIPIDIFIHYEKDKKYWHEGVKMRWYNDLFTLNYVDFLGKKYLIPSNYDHYLTENYGNWHIPKVDFDSTYDTPNGLILNIHEYIAYTYKMAVINYNNEKYDIYLNILQQNGENI